MAKSFSMSLPTKPAQAHPLPSQQFYSIEYPGYVSSSSIPTAIHTLGGQTCIDNVFRRIKRNSGRDNVVDLKFRPDNPFCHPVPGEVTGTNNLLLRVVKRKRRVVDGSQNPLDVTGEYTAQLVGIIPKTLRFRSMVDFQYQPKMEDPIPQLRSAMDRLDAQAIKDFKFEPEKEDYSISESIDANLDPSLHTSGEDVIMQETESSSNLQLIPPPLFSRQSIPQMYNFRQNPMSVVETAINEHTGQEKSRFINRFRWKGWSVISVSMSESEHFEERPVWTKLALLNQFPPAEAREISNTKYLIPLFCYVFIDGPWRDTLVRFGYDPRADIAARQYQRIYFRNVNNPTTRPSVTSRTDTRQQESARPDGDMNDDRRAHMFDGQTQTSETASFQLCDIVDPMLREMIEDESQLRDTCHERDGWYTSSHLERVKAVLRHKFFSLLDGRIATDDECRQILDAMAESGGNVHGPSYFRRNRKHNKAKGALPPEEETALRLRKVLQQEKDVDH
ncbi:hypothetical protein M422DRAFT_57318 [Sphaerobolus stellatus SS14]|nr:hypothetical protein M422DRAFT_57318 [Sphaerobolus stellatus SS14]